MKRVTKFLGLLGISFSIAASTQAAWAQNELQYPLPYTMDCMINFSGKLDCVPTPVGTKLTLIQGKLTNDSTLFLKFLTLTKGELSAQYVGNPQSLVFTGENMSPVPNTGWYRTADDTYVCRVINTCRYTIQ